MLRGRTFSIIAVLIAATTYVDVHTREPYLVKVRPAFRSMLFDLLFNRLSMSFEFWPIVIFFVDDILLCFQRGFIWNVPQRREEGLAMLIEGKSMKSMLDD